MGSEPMTSTGNDIDAEARAWVMRLASGTMSDDQMNAFHHWRARTPAHQAAFDEARAMWQAVGSVEAQVRQNAVRATRGHRRWPAAWLAVAALLLLALAWPQYGWMLRADQRTGHAIRSLALDDGSTVVLDAATAITVHFDARVRQVTLLHGRAWFEVAHGDARPFIVKALDGETRDVGTAFEVALNADDVQTSVSRGLVRVSADATGSEEGVRVSAGQRVHYGRDTPVSTPVPAGTSIAAWREGDIVLDGLPLAAALHEVARYRGAPVVVLGDFAHTAPVSVTFRSSEAEAAIRALAALGGAQVRELPLGVLVVQDGTGS